MLSCVQGEWIVRIRIRAAMAGGMLLAISQADAEPRITFAFEEYQVSGRTGAEIMTQIHRKGPRHGPMSRAIAQTRYGLDYGYRTEQAEGACRVAMPWVHLDIIHVYPQIPSETGPELRARWETFMQGVRAHEKGHADLAVEMARAAEIALQSFRQPASAGCARLKRDVDRMIRRIFATFERRQALYDRIEHRQDGPVARIIARLTGKDAGPRRQIMR